MTTNNQSPNHAWSPLQHLLLLVLLLLFIHLLSLFFLFWAIKLKRESELGIQVEGFDWSYKLWKLWTRPGVKGMMKIYDMVCDKMGDYYWVLGFGITI